MPLSWEEIETAAAEMFNVWTSCGDLEFAKEAWKHLECAGLTNDDDILSRTQSCLRLIALCRIYLTFSKAKWDEGQDTPITYLTEYLDINQVALGLLAAPNSPAPGYDVPCFEPLELYENALIAATKLLEPQILDCLRRAYGGDTGLYMRLCRTCSNSEEHDTDDCDVTGPNMDAYDFVRQGYIR